MPENYVVAPTEETQWGPWTSKFGGDGMGYVKMMSHPNRYVTGEEYTSVEPRKNYIGSSTAPTTAQGWMEYAQGDVVPLVDAAVEERGGRAMFEPLEALGIVNAPIVRMGIAPGLEGVAVDDTSNWDRMSSRDRRKANRQLNKDERRLNRDVRRDSRTEQAIARKFGSTYNPGNRAAVDERFSNERERIELMRRLLNG